MVLGLSRFSEGKTERLVSICRQADGGRLRLGPVGRRRISTAQQFRDAGIELVYLDYSGYPEYRQLFPPFEHRVSVFDLILNEGPDAPRYMLSF